MNSREETIQRYQYLIGQKIHKWTVLDIKFDRKKPDALCSCGCGDTVKLVNISNLLGDKSKDCGCGRKHKLSEIKGKDIIGKKFGKLTVLELLPERNKHNKRVYRCQCDCGNFVNVVGNSLTTNHSQSCGCINSVGNAYIHGYLDGKDIEHKCEYSVTINDAVYRFDFYLEQYNLFIEYDGIQHFQPTTFSGDEEKMEEEFKNVQRRDRVKNKYCKNNNYNLLRIPYWDFDNIESIINNCLQRLNEEGSFFYDYATV